MEQPDSQEKGVRPKHCLVHSIKQTKPQLTV